MDDKPVLDLGDTGAFTEKEGADNAAGHVKLTAGSGSTITDPDRRRP